MKRPMKLLALSFGLAASAFALGQARYVETVKGSGSFPLVEAKATGVKR